MPESSTDPSCGGGKRDIKYAETGGGGHGALTKTEAVTGGGDPGARIKVEAGALEGWPGAQMSETSTTQAMGIHQTPPSSIDPDR